MNSQVKYGLRNANDLLNRIRNKYKKQVQEENQLVSNKTFFEEESISLDQNHTRDEKKIQQTVDNKKINEIQHLSKIQQTEKDENSFCDRLIIQKLQQTLKIYENDLQIMYQNKSFLQDKIDFLIQKIKKLKELQLNNQILIEENQKSKNYLTLLVKQYHISMVQAFKSQLSSQEFYNLLRLKIKNLIKLANGDHYYTAFAQQWNKHIALLINNRKQINHIINDQHKQKNIEDDSKNKKIVINNNKKNRFQGEEFLTPDEPKPKKKLSQAEKASLLGDLKSFAKSFKFPNN